MANESVAKLKKLQEETQALLRSKPIEAGDQTYLSRLPKFTLFWVLVVTSFLRNRGPVRASALAYTTLLALIPLLAVGISVSTGMLTKEQGKPIQELIDKMVANIAPALNLEEKTPGIGDTGGTKEVAKRINEFIGNIRSGALGITSVIALVFVAISLLRTIEATFNDIWGVATGRTWAASTVHYWTTISLGPLVLILAFGLTTSGQLSFTQDLFKRMPFFVTVVFKVLPLVLLIFAFALLYQLMPNTRVRWGAAFVGGLVSGCLWQLNNVFNVVYVSKVVSYSKIYGSLGIIPLFLVGLYFSWLILLFGAQVAYSFQNRHAHVEERLGEAVNEQGKEFIALRLMTFIGRRFRAGEAPPTVLEMANGLTVPSRLTGQLLRFLVQAKLVVEVNGVETSYVPARPLAQISSYDVLQALRAAQGEDLATADEPTRILVWREFDRIREAERHAASVTTIEDLVAQAPNGKGSWTANEAQRVPLSGVGAVAES